MLAVQLNTRTKVYVDFEEDTFPNKGGYFCQVYGDVDKKFKINEFTIDKHDLVQNENKLKQAYVIANNKLKYSLNK